MRNTEGRSCIAGPGLKTYLKLADLGCFNKGFSDPGLLQKPPFEFSSWTTRIKKTHWKPGSSILFPGFLTQAIKLTLLFVAHLLSEVDLMKWFGEGQRYGLRGTTIASPSMSRQQQGRQLPAGEIEISLFIQIIQLFSIFFGLHTVCHVTIWGIVFTFTPPYLPSEVVNIYMLKSRNTREISQRRSRAPCFNSCCAGELRLRSEISEVPKKGTFQNTCWRLSWMNHPPPSAVPSS